METPYKYDPANKRVVINMKQSSLIYPVAGFIYVSSLFLYTRRFLRVDGNAVAAGAFAIFSAPAAYAHANFWLSDPETEAAIMNNEKEGKN